MKKETWKAGNMVYPLPAVMVSCGRRGERPNILTVAWTGTVCTDPAMLYISVRPERYSYHMLCDSREFAVNLTTEKLARATDWCGVRSGRDVDKFAETGLTPCASKSVGCPGIAESPVNIECRVTEIKNLGSHDLFLAAVENVGVEESLLDQTGRLQLSSSGLIVYSHGSYFALGNEIGSFGYSVRKKAKKPNARKKRK